MSLKIFILSPHFDDAAYGLTLHISGIIKSGLPLSIINCFTVTKWTAIPVEDKAIEAVSLLRAGEDVQYNTLFNSAIEFVNLNLLDAPLRNGYIFQFQPFQPNEWSVVQNLQDRLEDLLEDEEESILLCPMGIGNHIDHAICLEAVAELYHGYKVLFYEDLPYAARITQQDIEDHVKKLEQRLGVEFVHDVYSRNGCNIDKELAVRVYKSQMNDEICSEIVAHLNNLSGERIWGEEATLKKLTTKLNCDPPILP